MEKTLGSAGGWRQPDVVERVHRARRGLVDQHEAAAAAEAGHERLDDPERRADGDGRVDGVAAFEKHAQAGRGGQPVRRADDAVAPDAGGRNAPACGPRDRRGPELTVCIRQSGYPSVQCSVPRQLQ